MADNRPILAFAGTSWSLGMILAFGILVISVILGFMHLLDIPAVLLISAVCALKL